MKSRLAPTVLPFFLAALLVWWGLASCDSSPVAPPMTPQPDTVVVIDTVVVTDTLVVTDTVFVTDTVIVTDTLTVTDTLIVVRVIGNGTGMLTVAVDSTYPGTVWSRHKTTVQLMAARTPGKRCPDEVPRCLVVAGDYPNVDWKVTFSGLPLDVEFWVLATWWYDEGHSTGVYCGPYELRAAAPEITVRCR